MNTVEKSAESRELVLVRLIDAPPEKVFRAWTYPALLKQWFCPKPWTVASVEVDVRPGGTNVIVMRSPEGQEFPNRGVYLEVVKNERFVGLNGCVYEGLGAFRKAVHGSHHHL